VPNKIDKYQQNWIIHLVTETGSAVKSKWTPSLKKALEETEYVRHVGTDFTMKK
jgi:uncharacterized alpha/beta hydrolase family protein